MVSRRHTLTDAERDTLNAVANLLGLKQEELADLAEVSQAWLSITLSGKRANREVENLSRLAQALLEQFNRERVGLKIESAEADVFRRTLKRLGSLIESGSEGFVSPPGRAVPAQAQNYVRRAVDDFVDKCLESENLSIYVVGPFQVGKTSLLLRLRDEAKKKGYETAYFSCKGITRPRFLDHAVTTFLIYQEPSDREIEDDTRKFYRALKKHLTDSWGLKITQQLGDDDFCTWAEKALKFSSGRQAVVVLDDLDSLDPNVIYRITSDMRVVKNTNSFVSFVKGLLAVRSKERFDLVSSSSSFSYFVSSPSSIGDSSDTSALDWWFSDTQLEELMNCLDRADLKKRISSIRKRYGGQPLLTHLAIIHSESNEHLGDYDTQLQNLESELSAFELHKRLVRGSLLEAASMLGLKTDIQRYPDQKLRQEKLAGDYSKIISLIRDGDLNRKNHDVTDEIVDFLLATNVIVFGSYMLHTAEVKDAAGFLKRLKKGEDNLARYLFVHLSPETQEYLVGFSDKDPVSRSLLRAVVEDLNQVLKETELFDKERFSHTSVSEETLRLVKSKPSGDRLTCLNRLLLEEAYPQQIEKSRFIVRSSDEVEPMTIVLPSCEWYLEIAEGLERDLSERRINVEVGDSENL